MNSKCKNVSIKPRQALNEQPYNFDLVAFATGTFEGYKQVKLNKSFLLTKSGLDLKEAQSLLKIAGESGFSGFKRYIEITPPSAACIFFLIHLAQKELQSVRAKHAADKGHGQKGGSHDKREQIRKRWASGDYKTKTECATKECALIGMSLSTAIKSLQNQ